MRGEASALLACATLNQSKFRFLIATVTDVLVTQSSGVSQACWTPWIRVIDSWASILQWGRKSVTALKLGSRWPPSSRSRCPPPTSQRPPSERRKRRRLVHLCVQRLTARPSLRWPADLQLCSLSSELRGRLTPQLWFSFLPQELF